MTEKYIDSLMSELSSKLKTLQGSYSEFAEKCQKSEVISNEIQDSPGFLQSFQGLKQKLKESWSIVDKNKKAIGKSIGKLKAYGQGSGIKKVLEEFEAVFEGLERVESSIFATNSCMADVEKSVKSKIQKDSELIQSLENQVRKLKRAQSLGNWQESPVLTSRNLELSSQCPEETEFHNIIEKMTCETDRVSFSSTTFNKHNRLYIDSKEFTNKKIIDSLESEIRKLRNSVRVLEEKEIHYIEYRSRYESCQYELMESMNKAEELERTILEKDLKIDQLLKGMEESQQERKKNSECLKKVREAGERKNEDLELAIKKLKEQKSEQELFAQNLNYQLEVLSREKQEVVKENRKIKSSLEHCISQMKDLELKYKKSVEKVEKDSELSQQLLRSEEEKKRVLAELAEVRSQIKLKSVECESFENSLKSSRSELEKAKSNLDSLLLDYETLKSSSISNEIADSLQLKLEETQSLRQEYQSQLSSLQSAYDTLQQTVTSLNKKLSDRKSTIKNLKLQLASKQSPNTPVPELLQLKRNNESLLKDNESLLESHAFIIPYIESIKNSYKDTISDLTSKLNESSIKVKDLSEALTCQQYLYNDLEKKWKSNYHPQIRPMHRRHSSSENDKVSLKSFETLKKLFESQTFDINIVAMIGVELDEEDPKNFYDKILEMKKERDSYYMAAQKYEDLIIELKEALNEEDEFNLLSQVVNLKKKVLN